MLDITRGINYIQTQGILRRSGWSPKVTISWTRFLAPTKRAREMFYSIPPPSHGRLPGQVVKRNGNEQQRQGDKKLPLSASEIGRSSVHLLNCGDHQIEITFGSSIPHVTRGLQKPPSHLSAS